MKKSKADKKKIVARYMTKYEEFSKMTSEDLVKMQEVKMSSTDSVALRDAINQKMKEEIMAARAKKEEEPIIDVTKPIVTNEEATKEV